MTETTFIVGIVIQTIVIGGPICYWGGKLCERVSQLEQRLGHNGDSVPSRCRVQDERLDTHEERIAALELPR